MKFPRFQPEEIPLTPFMFFTGKGGVGKTSTASALAIHLADKGNNVLIVSTDPASNLQDVFETELDNEIRPVLGTARLFACNLDPIESAKAYREKVIGPFRGKLPDVAIQSMEEQLSGACTVEIAAFDEFTNLLTNPSVKEQYDYILFDTAPTGHTLRLLQLPAAWTDFLSESAHGASCLGPLSKLNEKKGLYAETVEKLSDSTQTTLLLVARPDKGSLKEAGRASEELFQIGMRNQLLLLNGVLQSYNKADSVSAAYFKKQKTAVEKLPDVLLRLPVYEIPLVHFSVTGRDALSGLFSSDDYAAPVNKRTETLDLQSFSSLIDDLETRQIKLVFTMGKGGVGKTTMAAAIAVGLSKRGHKVHLTTTDPAAHLNACFENGEMPKNLTASRIDPRVEVERYKERVLSKVSTALDDGAIEYIREDLESPCTEEIAVFQAFADVVGKSKNEIVVIDTAPTGHTLLLLDAANSYHQEIERSTGELSENVKELLPRLRNGNETEIVICALPEATPILEASRLQDDLKRAGITSHWWVVNQSLYAANAIDPVLSSRAAAEIEWFNKVKNDLCIHMAVVPWVEPENGGEPSIDAILNGKNH